MRGVFICYRRSDSSEWAAKLHARLSTRYGARSVFMDVAEIKAGDNFVAAIRRVLDAGDVVIALVGNNWLAATGKDAEPRLWDTSDYVRIELETAINHKLKIVPVLLDNAPIPRNLPSTLTPLLEIDFLSLTAENFDQAYQQLLSVIEDAEIKREVRLESTENDSGLAGPSRFPPKFRLLHTDPVMECAHLKSRLLELLCPVVNADAAQPELWQLPSATQNKVESWVDRFREDAEPLLHYGPEILGNTLTCFEVEIPPIDAWLSAPSPTDGKGGMKRLRQEYLQMSRLVQRALRWLIPYTYFNDLETLENLGAVWPLLTYRCLPISTAISRNREGIELNRDSDLYWDWPDRDLLMTLMIQPATIRQLQWELARLQKLLLHSRPKLAQFFEPSQVVIQGIINSVRGQFGRTYLNYLLQVEAILISQAHEFGTLVDKAYSGNESDHRGFRKAFVNICDKVHREINGMKSIYLKRESITSLVSYALSLSTSAFEPAESSLQPKLIVSVLQRSASAVYAKDFLEGKDVPKEVVALSREFSLS